MRYNDGMKVPTKFIKTLSQEDRRRLIENHQTSPNFRVRNRSHAILLSFEKFPIAEIAKICRVDRDTVSGWIDNWNEFQFEGLTDEEKPGRPIGLTAEEIEKAVEIGLRNPKFPHRQLNEIKVETGKEISAWTLKNLLKKKDYLWKRIRLGLWKQTDADEKEFARQDLAELTKKADAGKIDLAYFDGSGFNLWAKVVYAWQKRGERITVPVSKGKSQNVLGLMWHRCQRFESFVFEGSIDSNVVIGCFDLIAKKLTRETWIVLDNAPIHRSEEFEEKIEEWANKYKGGNQE